VIDMTEKEFQAIRDRVQSARTLAREANDATGDAYELLKTKLAALAGEMASDVETLLLHAGKSAAPIGTSDGGIAAVRALRPKLKAGHWMASWVPPGNGIQGFWHVVYRANRKASTIEWSAEPNPDGTCYEVENL
jgi:hypothetical protein